MRRFPKTGCPKISTLAIAALLMLPAAASLATTPETLTAKGIYHDADRFQRSGLKFRIVLDDGGKARRVPTTYPFHTGDRFTFTFEINRNTHIYVINRTQTSAPAPVSAGYQAKRIHRTRLSEPRLLFPTSQAGSNNRLTSNAAHKIPSRGHFVMDRESGIEKLYVVISDRRLDFGDFFDGRTGQLRGSPNPRAAALQAKLDAWKSNALVQLVPKGIRHEVDGYGVNVDAAKPAVVEIDLKHYR